MTEDNRKQAIGQDLRQSDHAMKGAELLRDAGLYNDALSRLYYALHHAASLLSGHFLPSGVLSAEDIAVVGRIQSYRDLADYNRAWEATPAIADEAFAAVAPLLARVRKALASGGWIEQE